MVHEVETAVESNYKMTVWFEVPEDSGRLRQPKYITRDMEVCESIAIIRKHIAIVCGD